MASKGTNNTGKGYLKGERSLGKRKKLKAGYKNLKQTSSIYPRERRKRGSKSREHEGSGVEERKGGDPRRNNRNKQLKG